MSQMMTPTPPDPMSQKRSLGLLATLMITAMFAVVLFSGPASRWWASFSLEGSQAQSFALTRVDEQGQQVKLEDFKGKVVVLDFWATWCPPCRQQMPILQRIHEDEAWMDKVQILSVNADEDAPDRAEKVRRFMDANGYSMLTVWADWPTMSAYHVESFPTLVIVDGQGKVRHLLRGAHDEASLRALIGQTLTGP